MCRQFKMIRRSEMPKVMTPYHGTMEPRHRVSLPQFQRNIVEET